MHPHTRTGTARNDFLAYRHMDLDSFLGQHSERSSPTPLQVWKGTIDSRWNQQGACHRTFAMQKAVRQKCAHVLSSPTPPSSFPWMSGKFLRWMFRIIRSGESPLVLQYTLVCIIPRKFGYIHRSSALLCVFAQSCEPH